MIPQPQNKLSPLWSCRSFQIKLFLKGQCNNKDWRYVFFFSPAPTTCSTHQVTPLTHCGSAWVVVEHRISEAVVLRETLQTLTWAPVCVMNEDVLSAF